MAAPETTLLSLRPTRLIALHWYILWVILWILSALSFLDPTGIVPDWRLFGYRLQSYGGAILGFLGLLVLLYAEVRRLSIKYLVTDARIVRKDGIVKRRTNTMPFSKIERVELTQGLIQRMFKLGDIVLDTGEDTVVLQSLGHVTLVQDEITKHVAAQTKRV